MISRLGRNNTRHFSRSQGKGGVFKGFLHLSTFKEPEISVSLERATVGTLLSILWKSLVNAFLLDECLVVLQFGHGVGGRESHLGTRTTTHWISTARVFDEQMSGADLIRHVPCGWKEEAKDWWLQGDQRTGARYHLTYDKAMIVVVVGGRVAAGWF